MILTYDIRLKSYKIKKEYGSVTPFEGTAVNDAKVSPNGDFAFFVGDDNGMWLSRLIYEKFEVQDAELEDINEWTDMDEGMFMDEYDASHSPCEKEEATDWKFQKFKRFDCSSMRDDKISLSQTDSLVGMQYISWSLNSSTVAITSDSHPIIIIVQVDENDDAIIKNIIRIGGKRGLIMIIF